ncbi:DUF7927 domain-containing protein [Curtobacterium oceanosedimentum]|uniref:DUF7927 domain-containing protein n=1 Tax=Curtobacterium oceanosedimentum TaxID=465820 RepID=UPI001CE21E4F|nr:CARDB domain-containing protein [Curtobacterium oceanosedimentum]MCA5923780.1 DUF11 domain-containing protein [Curtobacterium oceanosedimentum]
MFSTTVLPAAPASAADGPAWTCSANGYLFQSPGDGTNTIYQVDLVSGESTEIASMVNGVNATGYNQTDNYMYGWDTTTGQPVIVASDGTLTQLDRPAGLPADTNFVVGDVDPNGHYWLTLSSGQWYEIDYAAGSPTYGQVVDSGTAAGAAAAGFGSVRDWVYVDGSLYGVGTGPSLVEFDPAANRVTRVANLPDLANNAYGAGYADARGFLYFSNNTTGEIYRINPEDGSTIDLSTGPISGGNDGARCSAAGIPTISVQKTVDGRAATADQFTVALRDTDSSTLTSATTTGTATTAKSEEEWPVSEGRTYTVTDVMAAGSTNTIAAYTPTIVCTDTVTGAEQTVGGEAGTWTFRVPGANPYLCDVTNTAADPSLAVSKTVDKETANPGDTVTYTVTVRNTGNVAYTADKPATFTDSFSGVTDDATYNNDASTGSTINGNTLSWAGPLAVGATATVTYSFTVNTPDTGDHLLRNVVTPPPGSVCEPDPEGCEPPPVRVRDFTVAKSVDKTSAAPGEKVTYTVTVKNTGEADYTAENPATFADDFSGVADDATYNDDASNGATVDGTTLSWSGPLAVGESTTVTYSFIVNDPLTGDQNLGNVVTTPGVCAPNACETETLVRSFTVTKSVDADTAVPGQKVTYTVTVKNTGKDAYTADVPASFTDDLSKVTDDATYNKDASNGAKVDGNELSWAGPLAVGETIKVTYSFTVNTPDTGDHVLGNAVVPGDSGECVGACQTTTLIPGYTVSKAVDKTSVVPGETVTWTITVTNTGKVDYTAEKPAKFTDDLTQVTDDATYNGDATNGAKVDGNTLTWAGPLAVGDTTTVTYSFTVKDPNPGDEQLRNVVDPGPGTGVCATDDSCVTNSTVTAQTVTPSPSGPVVSTGGTTAAPLWPMFAGAGTALAVLMALLGTALVRRRNGDSV